MNSADEAAIRETFRRFSDACGRMDAEAAVAVFAGDDEVTLVGSEPGEMARGRAELEKFSRRILPASGGYSWEWEQMIVDGAGPVAWVFAEGHAQVGTGADAKRVPYRVSVVLERRDGEWKWRLFHGSEPA